MGDGGWENLEKGLQSMGVICRNGGVGRGMEFLTLPEGLDWRVTMPHRRTSGAKVRSHKIGIGKSRFQKGKQARLQDRKLMMDHGRGDAAE
jgi:hypothetical protein